MTKKLLFYSLMLSTLCAYTGLAQVITPASGFNFIACGTNTTLCDSGGCTGNYPLNANGYTVIRATGDAQITITGSFVVEGGGWDYIRIFSGIGTSGELLYHSGTTLSGTINLTGNPGQSMTVQLIADESFQYSGFNLNVIYTGQCADQSVLPVNGTLSIGCGQSGILLDNGGMAGDYTANNNAKAEFGASGTAQLTLNGNYFLGAGD